MRRRTRGVFPVALATVATLVIAAPLALAFDLPPAQDGVSVYDFAGVWSQVEVWNAGDSAKRLEAGSGVQLAIVSIPTGESAVTTSEAEQTAKQVMDAWGVGRAASNDGIVVLFDMDATLRHGQVYIYAGSGVLGRYLSTTAVSNIVDDMLAKAKSGDLDGALDTGLTEIAAAVDNPGSRLESPPLIPVPLLLLLLVDGALLLLMGIVWLVEGRDPRVPLVDASVLLPAPPPGLTPTLAAVLRQDGVAGDTMATALVDLASRGLLSMREGSGKAGQHRHAIDYVLADAAAPQVVEAEARLGEPERFLLTKLRSVAVGGVVSPRDLARPRHLQRDFGRALGKVALRQAWFRRDPAAAFDGLGKVVPLPGLVLFAMLFLIAGVWPNSSGPWILAMWPITLVAIGLGAVIANAMPARSKEGSQVLALTLAYRNTLVHELSGASGVASAEEHVKARLPWLETPDALIVWAVALGLAREVGETIGRAADSPSGAAWQPAWYAGSASFAAFGASISSITTTTASAAAGGYGGGVSAGGGGAGGGF